MVTRTRGSRTPGRRSVGTITRLHAELGFIRAVDGREVQFDRTDAPHFNALAVGDTVMFDLREQPGGNRATDVRHKDNV